MNGSVVFLWWCWPGSGAKKIRGLVGWNAEDSVTNVYVVGNKQRFWLQIDFNNPSINLIFNRDRCWVAWRLEFRKKDILISPSTRHGRITKYLELGSEYWVP
jgi:hypothetical protein